MNLSRSVALIIATVAFTADIHAEKAVTMKIGTVWPYDLLDNEKSTAWNASFQSGFIVDRKISFGAGLDFMWNVLTRERKSSGDALVFEEKKRMLSFPLSGFITLTPFPDLLIYPSLSGQVGFNTVYLSHDSLDIDNKSLSENEWYLGVIGKIAADAMYNLSEDVALLLGVEYQWSKPVHVPKDNTFKDMHGIGIRAGFRVIF